MFYIEYVPSESLHLQRKSLPNECGAYIFKDELGRALYVGKAKHLRKRIDSHFTNPSTRGGANLLELAVEIDVVLTDSEKEALLVEQSLVHQLNPRFNVRLRDGKSYPYIAISLDEAYPRVYITRETRKAGRLYFGPYESKWARSVLKTLGKIFQYRTCQGSEPGRVTGNPCLDYHIKLCQAPCVDYISQEDYRQNIAAIIRFMGGNWRETSQVLEQTMHAAAQKQSFEEAARLRDRLREVNHLLDREEAVNLHVGDGAADVIAASAEGDRANVQLFKIREGAIRERHSFPFTNEGGFTGPEVARDFIVQLYDKGSDIPPLILVPIDTPDLETLSEILSEWAGRVVKARCPQRGEKRRVLQLAEKNARFRLRQPTLRAEIHPSATLLELQGALGMERSPARIECFDISNLGEAHTVAAMAVFKNGEPFRAHYRRFRVRSVQANDYGALAEVLHRRVEQWKTQQEIAPEDPSYNLGFAELPDLIIIDGGKGQLAVGAEALQAFSEQGTTIGSLAKRLEEVHLLNRTDPLQLGADSPARFLLQRLRDEAHRFAVNYHRQKRNDAMLKSFLDDVPGVGPARRKQLLSAFPSPEKLREATQQELEAVVGPAVGQQVYAHLHADEIPG